MSKEQLQERLEELHFELMRLGNLDQEGQEKIEELAAYIRELLDDNAADQYPESLEESLRDFVRAMEVSHPRVTQLMSEIMNLLSSIGI